MKIKGFLVPLVDSTDPEKPGKVVDTEALKMAWADADAAEEMARRKAWDEGQDGRWTAFVKEFGADLAVKAPWFPIFEEAMNAFWGIKQYQYGKYAPTVVVDMIFDRVKAGHHIDPDDYTSVKDLLVEFLAEHTAPIGTQSRDLAHVMCRDAAKGPGAKLYLNPFVRAHWTATAD